MAHPTLWRSDNGISNGLEIFSDPCHGTVIMASNNDQKLRLFAAGAGEGSLRSLSEWPFDWAVNYATVRPGSNMAAVVGDYPATFLVDIHNGGGDVAAAPWVQGLGLGVEVR